MVKLQGSNFIMKNTINKLTKTLFTNFLDSNGQEYRAYRITYTISWQTSGIFLFQGNIFCILSTLNLEECRNSSTNFSFQGKFKPNTTTISRTSFNKSVTSD